MITIEPELVLKAYAVGIFPMSEARDDERIFWVDPDTRTIFPLDAFHLPRRLRRTYRSGRFDIQVNQQFANVIRACAAPDRGKAGTWINHGIEGLFTELHQMGFAHSVEVSEGGKLVGGLYGLAIGGAFFGESMFSIARDASKIALVHLAGRLIIGGFALLDAQFMTEHLRQFGAREISREDYQSRLANAIDQSAAFDSAGADFSTDAVLQSITQIS